jgi:hypothetical protein
MDTLQPIGIVIKMNSLKPRLMVQNYTSGTWEAEVGGF